MTFLMIGEDGLLAATNASTPTEGWARIPQRGPRVGCPSIKHVDGTFYVVGGGVGVRAWRSADLVTWTPANASVMACGGARADADRRPAHFPGVFDWRPPTRFGVDYAAFVANDTNGWDRDASELDLVEWDSGGSDGAVTLLVYICGNQRTDGLGALAAFNGTMAEYFASLWW